MKIELSVEVDEARVWEDVWGNDGQGFAYWCTAVRDSVNGKRADSFNAWKRDDNGKIVEDDEGDWIPDPHEFSVYDGEADLWTIVTVENLCRAWVQVRQEGLTHCGGYSIDEPDACTEDFYLQYAVFGEVIYG